MRASNETSPDNGHAPTLNCPGEVDVGSQRGGGRSRSGHNDIPATPSLKKKGHTKLGKKRSCTLQSIGKGVGRVRNPLQTRGALAESEGTTKKKEGTSRRPIKQGCRKERLGGHKRTGKATKLWEKRHRGAPLQGVFRLFEHTMRVGGQKLASFSRRRSGSRWLQ